MVGRRKLGEDEGNLKEQKAVEEGEAVGLPHHCRLGRVQVEVGGPGSGGLMEVVEGAGCGTLRMAVT